MRRRIALCLCALLALSACGLQGEDPGAETWSVYFSSATLGNAALAAEARVLDSEAEPVEGLLRLLLAGPESEALTSPIPAGTRVLSWSLEDSGVLKLDLSERYGGLAGAALTQADYAIALTLCQAPGVEAVSITVEGEAVSFRDHQLLRPSDVILSGAEDAPVYITADLWFLRGDETLGVEQRELLITENDNLASVLLAALMDGPRGEGLYFPLPQGTELLSAETENGVCFLNFSAGFAQSAPQDSHEAALLLFAMVNTLCAQESIDTVQLLEDGAPLPAYGGIPTGTPLEANLELGQANP